MKKIPIKHSWMRGLGAAALALTFAALGVTNAFAQAKKPNILVIFGARAGARM